MTLRNVQIIAHKEAAMGAQDTQGGPYEKRLLEVIWSAGFTLSLATAFRGCRQDRTIAAVPEHALCLISGLTGYCQLAVICSYTD